MPDRPSLIALTELKKRIENDTELNASIRAAALVDLSAPDAESLSKLKALLSGEKLESVEADGNKPEGHTG